MVNHPCLQATGISEEYVITITLDGQQKSKISEATNNGLTVSRCYVMYEEPKR